MTSFERRLPRSGIVLYSRDLAPSGRVVELLGDPVGVLGRSAEQLRSIPWGSWLHPDDVDRIAAEVAELSPGEERALHYRVRTADGRSRTVRDTVRRSEDAPETLVGVLWDASEEGALRARGWRCSKSVSAGCTGPTRSARSRRASRTTSTTS